MQQPQIQASRNQQKMTDAGRRSLLTSLDRLGSHLVEGRPNRRKAPIQLVGKAA